MDGDTSHCNKQILRVDISSQLKFCDSQNGTNLSWGVKKSVLAQGRDAFLHLILSSTTTASSSAGS